MRVETIRDPRSPRNHAYAVKCRNAWVSAQSRSVATVITVGGCLDETELESMARHVCRFTRLGSPLVLDVTHVAGNESGESGALGALVAAFHAACSDSGIEWVLVRAATTGWRPQPRDSVVCAGSVTEAMAYVARTIRDRRHLPLALLTGSSVGAGDGVDELAHRRRRARGMPEGLPTNGEDRENL